MDEEMIQNPNAEATGELADETLDHVAGGSSYTDLGNGFIRWTCPHCNTTFTKSHSTMGRFMPQHEMECNTNKLMSKHNLAAMQHHPSQHDKP